MANSVYYMTSNITTQFLVGLAARQLASKPTSHLTGNRMTALWTLKKPQYKQCVIEALCTDHSNATNLSILKSLLLRILLQSCKFETKSGMESLHGTRLQFFVLPEASVQSTHKTIVTLNIASSMCRELIGSSRLDQSNYRKDSIVLTGAVLLL